MDTLERIKYLRTVYGYTQEEVAKHLGLTQEGYSKIENGYVRLAGDTVCMLAKLYNVSTDYILLGEKKEGYE